MVSVSDAARELVRLLPAVALNLRLATLIDREVVDLTANQILALELIGTAPGGRMKAGDVAGRMGISSPAATALVDRLVGAGVVTRSHGDDRRVIWVSATDEGRAILDRLAEGLEKVIEAAIRDGDDASTLDALVDGMRRVASFADRIGEPHARSTSRGRPIDADDQPPP